MSTLIVDNKRIARVVNSLYNLQAELPDQNASDAFKRLQSSAKKQTFRELCILNVKSYIERYGSDSLDYQETATEMDKVADNLESLKSLGKTKTAQDLISVYQAASQLDYNIDSPYDSHPTSNLLPDICSHVAEYALETMAKERGVEPVGCAETVRVAKKMMWAGHQTYLMENGLRSVLQPLERHVHLPETDHTKSYYSADVFTSLIIQSRFSPESLKMPGVRQGLSAELEYESLSRSKPFNCEDLYSIKDATIDKALLISRTISELDAHINNLPEDKFFDLGGKALPGSEILQLKQNMKSIKERHLSMLTHALPEYKAAYANIESRREADQDVSPSM